jgi:hypothetical protein
MNRILLSLFALINNNSDCSSSSSSSSSNDNNPIIESAQQQYLSLSSTSSSSSSSSSSSAAAVTFTHDAERMCRSNATHIVWKDSATTTTTSMSSSCWIQTRLQAEQDCFLFLQNNLMPFDKPFRETMGFPIQKDDNNYNNNNTSTTSSSSTTTSSTTTVAVDGLEYGLIQPTIRLALDAKIQYLWTDSLPRHIFMDYVLNYANLNEARTNWRPLLVHALQLQFQPNHTKNHKINTDVNDDDDVDDVWVDGYNDDYYYNNITSVTTWVNTHLWTKLARHPDHPIHFQPSQTPLIFDPMSTIAYGYASCTGTSILFCNALRSLGIPARVVGTPAWYGNVTQGNHNWVEVYVGKKNQYSTKDTTNHDNTNVVDDDDGWKFLEPSPALDQVDTLDKDPCQRWFCHPSRFPSSRVYAAKLSRQTTRTTELLFFPLAWEHTCQDVPAVDRTDYYARICQRCHQEEVDQGRKEGMNE